MSINSIFVLHTSWMISRQVDLVETNPYKKLFYLSFDPSADNDVATILSSFRKMKETSKIRLPSSPPASFLSICFHPNQRPSPAHLHAYFLVIILGFNNSTTSRSPNLMRPFQIQGFFLYLKTYTLHGNRSKFFNIFGRLWNNTDIFMGIFKK